MLCVQSNCVQDNDFIQSMTLAKGKSPVITFKLASLVFRCLNGTAPLYLADSINCAAVVETRRSLRLRSSSLTAVDVPVTRRSTFLLCSGNDELLEVCRVMTTRQRAVEQWSMPERHRLHCGEFLSKKNWLSAYAHRRHDEWGYATVVAVHNHWPRSCPAKSRYICNNTVVACIGQKVTGVI